MKLDPGIFGNDAKQTVANFIEKASRLYEQKRRSVSAVSPLEMYVRRWMRWALSGAIVIPVENTLFRATENNFLLCQ